MTVVHPRLARNICMRIGYPLLLALSAFAVGLPPAAAEDTTVQITKADCRRLVRHVPSADVAYKPGVDVRGRPVAPADAGGGPRITLPDVFEFDVTIDVRKYLGGPEADAAAASAAVLAADKATAAATSAATAATAAEAASTSAAAIAATAAADSATAAAAVEAAVTARAADPTNQTLKAAVKTAETAAETAAATSATAAADAATIAAAAATAKTAAETAASATLAADKASAAATAAAAATTTASLATAAAGDDAAKAALATAATSAASAATSASTAAVDSATTNTALIAAERKSQKFGAMTMGVGRVSFNIKTGALTFNGQPLTDPDQTALAEACRDMLKKGR
jgi:hypothetical protein